MCTIKSKTAVAECLRLQKSRKETVSDGEKSLYHLKKQEKKEVGKSRTATDS